MPLLCCSGIARFPAGVPAELQAACIRQVWGPGARAGTYQISGAACISEAVGKLLKKLEQRHAFR